jgi:hypothetical protein
MVLSSIGLWTRGTIINTLGNTSIIFNVLIGLGSVLQFIAFGVLLKIIQPHLITLRSRKSTIASDIFKLLMVLFLLKMLLQLLISTSCFLEIISNQVDFTAGYIYWVFLGILCLSLFGCLHHFKLMELSKRSNQLFIIRFLLTETLLFNKGIAN